MLVIVIIFLNYYLRFPESAVCVMFCSLVIRVFIINRTGCLIHFRNPSVISQYLVPPGYSHD